MPQIMLVGEAWGKYEDDVGSPFVGPSGQVLNRMLRDVGIRREDCWITNTFNFRPPDNKLKYLGGPKAEAIPGWPQLGQGVWIREKYKVELDRLFEEIEACQPNVIIALGAVALWALCKQTAIKKYRGTPLVSHEIAGKLWKVFPTYHPSAVMRQWQIRPVVLSDLAKAAYESDFPEIRRPRRFIHIEPEVEDIREFYERYIRDAPVVSCDIETKGEFITEVGFAPRPDRALVIPFYSREKPRGHYWDTLEEEVEAWKWVRRILIEKPLIGQNFSYDIQYFWRQMRMPTPIIADDTMILHHSMEPEMEKSLGFLGSIYTLEPSWKFMRTDHSTLKRED